MDVHTAGEALLKSQTHPQMCCWHPSMKNPVRRQTPHTTAGDPRQQPKVVTCRTKPSSKHTDTCMVKTGPPGLEET